MKITIEGRNENWRSTLINGEYQSLIEAVEKNKSNLMEAELDGVDLSGADLSGGLLRYAHLSRAILVGTNLTGADLGLSNLAWANLKNADMSKSELTWVDMKEADLTNACLVGAALMRADLTKSNLSGTNLMGADLREVNGLKTATIDSETDFRAAIGLNPEQLGWIAKKGGKLGMRQVLSLPSDVRDAYIAEGAQYYLKKLKKTLDLKM